MIQSLGRRILEDYASVEQERGSCVTQTVLIASAIAVYIGVAALVIRVIWRRSAPVPSLNRRLAIRSLAIAVFWAPSISVPASIPVPALSMFVLWSAVALRNGFDPTALYALVALGVAPIATVAALMFGVARISAGLPSGR